jgi:hypothetical protein
MRFQIKDQEYFLAFVEDERQWFLFTQTASGLQRIAVYVDAVKGERSLSERAAHNVSS